VTRRHSLRWLRSRNAGFLGLPRWRPCRAPSDLASRTESAGRGERSGPRSAPGFVGLASAESAAPAVDHRLTACGIARPERREGGEGWDWRSRPLTVRCVSSGIILCLPSPLPCSPLYFSSSLFSLFAQNSTWGSPRRRGTASRAGRARRPIALRTIAWGPVVAARGGRDVELGRGAAGARGPLVTTQHPGWRSTTARAGAPYGPSS